MFTQPGAVVVKVELLTQITQQQVVARTFLLDPKTNIRDLQAVLRTKLGIHLKMLFDSLRLQRSTPKDNPYHQEIGATQV
jgi:hypothetical protein